MKDNIKSKLLELVPLLREFSYKSSGKIDEILSIQGSKSIGALHKLKKEIDNYEYGKAFDTANLIIDELSEQV